VLNIVTSSGKDMATVLNRIDHGTANVHVYVSNKCYHNHSVAVENVIHSLSKLKKEKQDGVDN
jgi:hypothetical protein